MIITNKKGKRNSFSLNGFNDDDLVITNECD